MSKTLDIVFVSVGLIRMDLAVVLAPDSGDVLLHDAGDPEPDVAELLRHLAALGLGLKLWDELGDTSEMNPRIKKNGPTPASFLFMFVFSKYSTEKISSQWDSNADLPSRRRGP